MNANILNRSLFIVICILSTYLREKIKEKRSITNDNVRNTYATLHIFVIKFHQYYINHFIELMLVSTVIQIFYKNIE